MMRFIKCFILATFTLLVGCTPDNGATVGAEQKQLNIENTTAIQSPQVLAYVSKQDLPAIKERGVIRFVAPRFDGSQSLLREGIPMKTYQDLADAYAESLGLSAQWVYVDGFSELLPTIEDGKADVVITNMTITKERAAKWLFTRPLTYVSEIIVSAAPMSDLEEIESIAVPAGTAYVESLKNQLGDNFPVQLLPSTMSDTDVLEAISDGSIEASVLDSNVANVLLPEYPTVHLGPVVSNQRPIAWALRKTNPLLSQSINTFLSAHHVRDSYNQAALRDWDQIVESGRLRMVTTNNPASYFMWKGELMGFDYDLIEKFARDNKLHLSVILEDSLADAIEAVKNGEGDFIAASMSVSESRKAAGLVFSHPYLKLDEMLLHTNPEWNELSDVSAAVAGINPTTSFTETLEYLSSLAGEIQVKEYPDHSTEELIQGLVQGEFDIAFADGHLAMLELTYRDDLQVIPIPDRQAHIAWGLRADQPFLQEKLDTFAEQEYRGLFYNVTFNKYFKNERNKLRHKDHRIDQASGLSPYDDLVQTLSKEFSFDWRMVTAQMYQESRFDPEAVSFAGALGLMQVMPRTGKEFGYTELSKPEVGLRAGLDYLRWLEDRFRDDLAFEERIYFVLASYNAGAGHVRDARRLADNLGLDKNKWFGHTERAMLLLSKPEHYKNARFGYVRGSEPVNYVREIRQRYLAYIDAGKS